MGQVAAELRVLESLLAKEKRNLTKEQAETYDGLLEEYAAPRRESLAGNETKDESSLM